MKYAAYGFLAVALLFAAAMGYLRYMQSDGRPADGSESSGHNPILPGKLVIAYAGDLKGSLDPCG